LVVAAFRSDLREYVRHVRALRAARETSARSFVAGLRYPLAHRQPIWIGSPTVIEGRERIEFADGAALRVGMGAFGLSTKRDTSIIRVHPEGRLRCEGVVSLQRGVRVVVDSGVLELAPGANINGFAKILVRERVSIGAYCNVSWNTQLLDNDFHPMVVDGVEQPMSGPIILEDRAQGCHHRGERGRGGGCGRVPGRAAQGGGRRLPRQGRGPHRLLALTPGPRAVVAGTPSVNGQGVSVA
jgi:hypothetical protein